MFSIENNAGYWRENDHNNFVSFNLNQIISVYSPDSIRPKQNEQFAVDESIKNKLKEATSKKGVKEFQFLQADVTYQARKVDVTTLQFVRDILPRYSWNISMVQN